MNFENPPVQEKSKYEPGFKEEALQDEGLIEQAKKQADFYLRECKVETPPDNMIVLVHFFQHPDITKTKILKNSSKFFDTDINYLEESGFNMEDVLKKFNGEDKYVVAIPLDKLDKWINTSSWLKLSKAGALENVVIFFIPKKDVILREHKYVETTFNHPGEEDVYKENAFNYYNSSEKIGDDMPNLEMPEAWIPHSVSLENAKILKFKED